MGQPQKNQAQKEQLNSSERKKLYQILSAVDFSKLKTQYGNPKIRDIPEIKVVYSDFKISVKGRNNALPRFEKSSNGATNSMKNILHYSNH